jgi:hypothetical protein
VRCRSASRTSAGERGAAAVEAGLLVSFVLVPLLLGVLYYGNYFWRAQHVSAYAPRVPQAGVVGELSCSELVARVKQLALGAVADADHLLGSKLGLDDVAVDVVRVLPTVGADVRVSVRVPAVSEALAWLPLPHGGDLVSDVLVRLDNVSVTTTSC